MPAARIQTIPNQKPPAISNSESESSGPGQEGRIPHDVIPTCLFLLPDLLSIRMFPAHPEEPAPHDPLESRLLANSISRKCFSIPRMRELSMDYPYLPASSCSADGEKSIRFLAPQDSRKIPDAGWPDRTAARVLLRTMPGPILLSRPPHRSSANPHSWSNPTQPSALFAGPWVHLPPTLPSQPPRPVGFFLSPEGSPGNPMRRK